MMVSYIAIIFFLCCGTAEKTNDEKFAMAEKGQIYLALGLIFHIQAINHPKNLSRIIFNQIIDTPTLTLHQREGKK
jgi:hypothetical protein